MNATPQIVNVSAAYLPQLVLAHRCAGAHTPFYRKHDAPSPQNPFVVTRRLTKPPDRDPNAFLLATTLVILAMM